MAKQQRDLETDVDPAVAEAQAQAARNRVATRGKLEHVLGKVDGFLGDVGDLHATIDASNIGDKIAAAVLALQTLRESVHAVLHGAGLHGKPGEQPPFAEPGPEPKPDEEEVNP